MRLREPRQIPLRQRQLPLVPLQRNRDGLLLRNFRQNRRFTLQRFFAEHTPARERLSGNVIDDGQSTPRLGQNPRLLAFHQRHEQARNKVRRLAHGMQCPRLAVAAGRSSRESANTNSRDMSTHSLTPDTEARSQDITG